MNGRIMYWILKRFTPTDKSEEGLTLLEVLVVLFIMAAVTLVVGPRVLKYIGQAKTDTGMVQLENVSSALELYFLETGQYPTSSQGLGALIEAPIGVENWDGPYLKKASGIIDPWGREFLYRYPGKNGEFDIYSLGADNAQGGTGDDQDINSWAG